MNKNYLKLITKIKKEQTNNDETILEKIVFNAKKNKKNKKEKDDLIKLYNVLIDDKEEKNVEKIKNLIKYKNEYVVDNITFGVVCLKNVIYSKIEYDKENKMIQNKKTVYDTKIVIIDEFNEIDNIMAKRFETKSLAIKYAEKLWNQINNKSLEEIITLIDTSL